MKATDRRLAVLTGDLVDSSKLSAERSKRALELLSDAATRFSAAFPGSRTVPLDTFRHDSWQWFLDRPEWAIRACLFLRAELKMHSAPDEKLDTRIAIGIGTAEAIDELRVSNSRGPAFTVSGKALDAMRDERLTLAFEESLEKDLSGLALGSIPLLDSVVNDWTPVESRAVSGGLLGWTQEQTAEQWPADADGKQISRQAIGSSLARAHWSRVESFLQWAEATISSLPGGE